MLDVITDNLDIWTTAQKQKKAVGRGKAKKEEGYGIKKLRELILELAVRGKLVPQDPNDEPASVLLERIAEEKQRLIDEGKIKKQKALPEIGEDENPFDTPVGWEWVRLQNITTYIQRGKGPKYADHGKVRVVSQKCIQWKGFDLEKSRFVDDASLSKYQEERFLKPNDLLWNSTGTGTVGRILTLNDDFVDNTLVADSHVTVIRPINTDSQFLCSYLAAPEIQLRIDPTHERSLVSGTTKQVELNTGTIIPLLVPLPPLAEQHRIVAKVDELMALCDQLEQEQADHQATHQTLVKTLLNGLILRYGSLRQAQGERSYSDCPELVEGHVRSNTVHPELVVRQAHHVRGNAVHPELVEGSALSSVSSELFEEHFDTLFTTEDSIDQLKQTILQLAVMGKLVPQNPKDEPASVLLEKIAQEKAKLIKEGKIKKQKALPEITEDEKPFGLPVGWEWSRLNDAIDVRDGTHDSPKDSSDQETYPLVTSKDFKDGKIDFETARRISAEDHFEISQRSLVEVDDILFSMIGGNLGNQVIVTDDRPFSVKNVALFKYYDKSLTSPYFMKTYFENLAYTLQSIASGGAQPFISLGALRKLIIALPPLAEQHRIVTKVNQLLSLCDTLKANLNQAQTTQTQLADTIVKQAVN